jgi:hypothetical protein
VPRSAKSKPGRDRDEGRAGVIVILLSLAAGFLVFMALIGAVHALDRWTLDHYGYAPFAPVNVLAMLIPSGCLLAGLAMLGRADLDALKAAADPVMLLGLAACAGLAMACLIGRRTNAWVALFAAALLLAGAPVLLFSVLFRAIAGAGQTED